MAEMQGSPQPELADMLSRIAEQGTAPSATTPATTPATGTPTPANAIYQTYRGDQGSEITVYSNDGQRKPLEAFDAAAEHYATTGKDSKGFIVLKPGLLNTMRSTYEQVNQPVQEIAPRVGRAVGREFVGENNPVMSALQRYGIMNQGQAEGLRDTAGNVGSGIAGTMAESVNTPEKAGATAGMALGSMATGGMSLLPQVAGTGLGATLGYSGGSLATGGGIQPAQAVIAGGLAAAAQGFVGVLKYGLGFATSQRAQKQVSEGLMNTIKSKYGNVGNPVSVLEQMGSSPGDIAKLTKIGIDGIVEDFNAGFAPLRQDILQATSSSLGNLSKGTQNTIRAQLNRITDAGRDTLVNVGDGKALAAASERFDNASTAISEAIRTDLKNLPPKLMDPLLAKADNILQSYWQSLDKYKPGATVLKALKDSGADEGFSAAAFQKTLQQYAQPPGTLMGEVGDIARRGGSYSATDKPVGLHVNIGKMLGLPQNIPVLSNAANIGANIGTRYAGTVRGTLPTIDKAATIAGTQAVRSFLERKK